MGEIIATPSQRPLGCDRHKPLQLQTVNQDSQRHRNGLEVATMQQKPLLPPSQRPCGCDCASASQPSQCHRNGLLLRLVTAHRPHNAIATAYRLRPPRCECRQRESDPRNAIATAFGCDNELSPVGGFVISLTTPSQRPIGCDSPVWEAPTPHGDPMSVYVKKLYQGMSFNRTKREPLERALAIAWQESQERSHTLEYLLSGGANRRVDVSDRDHLVAATIIQWLGSPVGQAFLEDAKKKVRT
jgi:hypothetical protein